MSKKLFGGKKKAAEPVAAAPVAKGPIITPLGGDPRKRRGLPYPTIVGGALNSTLGGG